MEMVVLREFEIAAAAAAAPRHALTLPTTPHSLLLLHRVLHTRHLSEA